MRDSMGWLGQMARRDVAQPLVTLLVLWWLWDSFTVKELVAFAVVLLVALLSRLPEDGH